MFFQVIFTWTNVKMFFPAIFTWANVKEIFPDIFTWTNFKNDVSSYFYMDEYKNDFFSAIITWTNVKMIFSAIFIWANTILGRKEKTIGQRQVERWPKLNSQVEVSTKRCFCNASRWNYICLPFRCFMINNTKVSQKTFLNDISFVKCSYNFDFPPYIDFESQHNDLVQDLDNGFPKIMILG